MKTIQDKIAEINDDEMKLQLARDHKLSGSDLIWIIKSFSDENKKKIILEDKDGFADCRVTDLISSLSTEAAIDFINNQQEFLESKEIKPYEITRKMVFEKQFQIIDKIEELRIPEAEKRKIFVSVQNEIKEAIDLEKIDEKYRELVGIRLTGDSWGTGKIIPKFGEDYSKYKGLDELISVNPLETVKSDEERRKLLELCKICPNMKIQDDLKIGRSTGEEYVNGEEWINSVLNGIQPEWTDVQKLAHIDTAIGKKISYTPEFGTEVEDHEDARALWKIITSGYGVCNGIAQVEQYLLGRVGIQSQMVSGYHHSFVMVRNIQIPTAEGIIQGDTLVDPTWNLTSSRYRALPQHFCKSYEELRKVDIGDDGKDHKCHKNEELEQAITINMDTQTLREVYKSIGIAGEDGKFPIGELTEQSRMESNITAKFALLKKWCPEFAICQNSTIEILQSILFEHNEHFDFKRCVASRVYDKTDSEKKAVLYVYIELENGDKQFFYADKEKGEFVPLSQEEFETKFDCYEKDVKKSTDHKRPWETDEKIQENKENSSGQVTSEEGR